ncbi:serpin B3-like isoform X2 [Plodia interpunctella]|uniref:serpin B3-like isoform X2 n=1 Tax=Plodia interpunctella TaxID=58824 RepID=UPI0023685784|nr:serpin B3-like isoform X2 [Plodia interpunctella]
MILKVYSKVKSNKSISIQNKIIFSKKNKENTQKYYDSGIHIDAFIDFDESNDLRNVILSWAKYYEEVLQNIDKYLTPETCAIFLNTCTIKQKWKDPIDGKTPMMKVYNSFNYTQDVKYEARLLELPLQDDLKLVVTVPNEQDTLSTLVTTLTEEGMEAAVHSIQPLFTSSVVLVAPQIKFDSKVTTLLRSKTVIQYGGIDINENGLSAEVLTCLFTHNEENSSEFKEKLSPPSFFFAIILKDSPIFTGNFIPTSY